MSNMDQLHLVENYNNEDGGKKKSGIEMPTETKKLVIDILNEYLNKESEEIDIDSRKTLEVPVPYISELTEFAQNTLGDVLKDGKIPEDAKLEEIVLAYRQLYEKIGPHWYDWDPTGMSDDEVVLLLEKRFGGIPRHQM